MTNEEAIKFLSQIMDAILVSNSWLPSTDNPIKESFGMAINALKAQPEQLTDKEQRIFLAAMGREEKVCKQVDDECRNYREPYEDSLVRTCHEITRKVKGALWTI